MWSDHAFIYWQEDVLSMWVNVLRMMPNILLPLLIQFAICELNDSLSSTITPTSFSSDVVARVCVLPSGFLIVYAFLMFLCRDVVPCIYPDGTAYTSH